MRTFLCLISQSIQFNNFNDSQLNFNWWYIFVLSIHLQMADLLPSWIVLLSWAILASYVDSYQSLMGRFLSVFLSSFVNELSCKDTRIKKKLSAKLFIQSMRQICNLECNDNIFRFLKGMHACMHTLELLKASTIEMREREREGTSDSEEGRGRCWSLC